MLLNNDNTQKKKVDTFQWKYVIGFMFSTVLAAFALWATFYSGYSFKGVTAVIAVLAFSQAIMQLFAMEKQMQEG